MRSAADWLASSDDDEEEKTVSVLGRTVAPAAPTATTPKVVRRQPGSMSSSVSPDAAAKARAPAAAAPAADDAKTQRQREAEQRRKEAQELRERMQAALGTAAVDAVDQERKKKEAEAAKPPVSTSPTMEAKKPSVHDRIKSVFDSFTSDESSVVHQSNNGPLPPPAPGTVRPLAPDALQGGPADDEMVIMVANRGTQTATEVSCQTDPEPHTVGCPMCYREYYGHDGTAYSYCGTSHDPYHGSFVPLHPVSHGLGGAAAMRGLRAQAGPQQPTVVPTAVYKQQVDLVRQQLDNIIRRHNLPAMPAVS